MLPMTETKITPVRIPEKIKAAFEKWCRENEQSISEAMIVALLEKIKKPELAKHLRKRGRPVVKKKRA
jgi:hypothetical protein